MTRKFEFGKTYEEVEVSGKVYRLEFNDNKIKEYQQKFIEIQKEYSELLKIDETKMSEEQALEHFDEIKKVAKEAVTVLLGEGSFDSLYEASGHSIANVFDFIWYLADIVKERSEKNMKDKKSKYVRK
jgi:hypothetical protein